MHIFILPNARILTVSADQIICILDFQEVARHNCRFYDHSSQDLQTTSTICFTSGTRIQIAAIKIRYT